MIWQEEMSRVAVQIALPEWDLQDSDVATVEIHAYPGEYYDEFDFEDEDYRLVVHVKTADGRNESAYEYTRKKLILGFLLRLIESSSVDEVSVVDALARIAKRDVDRSIERERAKAKKDIKGVRAAYESAMKALSVNDAIRPRIHAAAQNNGQPVGMAPQVNWGA